ncbi:MAG: ferritin-like domain-containing protein [Betaproteobacteria bacterium]|nr:ferritin-like domain-containing protein [Betaproteobacteria bacterium]
MNATSTNAAPVSLREAACAAWLEAGVDRKLSLVDALPKADEARDFTAWPQNALTPGRPERPRLVEPAAVERRSLSRPEGRAALIHALAHIEFNAVNLALDAIWRFAGLPADYYADWRKVATEEAMHFGLLRQHLADLDYQYGDFPAHDGLWDMARRTAHDSLARMALVPRVLEARGLDASPGIKARLAQAGDARGAEIVQIILDDEIGHVAIGTRWFQWLCAARGVDADSTFQDLLAEYSTAPIRSAPNVAARKAAGFSDAEIAWLSAATRKAR